ncbi:hypothetical protein F511_44929, partial [Dorcoceras hygrometricum]
VGQLKSEAIHAWDLSNEEFLQSYEFDTLCAKKDLRYFKDGFSGCLAQFRANGYSEEEHPASFLDTKKAFYGDARRRRRGGRGGTGQRRCYSPELPPPR